MAFILPCPDVIQAVRLLELRENWTAFINVHTCLCTVSTKTISLDEEAYERLKAMKREGESFSDVVKRLAGERSWREVAGIWTDGTDEIEAAVEAGRERSRERRDAVSDEIDG